MLPCFKGSLAQYGALPDSGKNHRQDPRRRHLSQAHALQHIPAAGGGRPLQEDVRGCRA